MLCLSPTHITMLCRILPWMPSACRPTQYVAAGKLGSVPARRPGLLIVSARGGGGSAAAVGRSVRPAERRGDRHELEVVVLVVVRVGDRGAGECSCGLSWTLGLGSGGADMADIGEFAEGRLWARFWKLLFWRSRCAVS